MGKEVTIKKATFIYAASTYTTAVLAIVFSGILSRLLDPNIYGVYSALSVFVVFFQLLSDMGFGTAVIQNRELTEKDIQNIFSFTIYLGFLLAILFCASSWLIAAFYKDSIYIELTFVLSISLLFATFNMIPKAMLMKSKKFKIVAIRNVVVSIASHGIAIYMAFNGFGIYALIVQSISSSLFQFVWNELDAKLKFNFRIDFTPIKKIWSYSINQFGASSINYLNRNLDNMLIGNSMGTVSLGYYSKAYTLSRYPVTYLPSIISSVLHPILAEHQDDKDYIYEKYMSIVQFLSISGCFISAFCFFAADELILIIFGEKWTASVMPFKVLSLSLWTQIIVNTVGPIYQSLGKTKALFKISLITLVITTASIIIGVSTKNLDIVAIMITASNTVVFFITYAALIKREFSRSFMSFLASFKWELLFFIIMIGAAYLYPFAIESRLLNFAVKLVYLTVIFGVLLLVSGKYKQVIALLKKK